jgi:uncharacterized membrane protein YjjB (DUF3815 family)
MRTMIAALFVLAPGAAVAQAPPTVDVQTLVTDLSEQLKTAVVGCSTRIATSAAAYEARIAQLQHQLEAERAARSPPSRQNLPPIPERTER